MTAVGPLTTTFHAPPSCTPQLYQVFSGSESSYIQGPLFNSDSNCFPSSYDPAPTNYYSPGFCPHGYTVACSSLASGSTDTETAVACCPTEISYTCLAPISTSPGSSQQPLLGCTTTWTSALANLEGVVLIADGTTAGTTTTYEAAGGITAYAVRIRFRSGDPTPAPQFGGSDTISVIHRTSAPTVSIPTQLLIPQPTSPPSGGVSTAAAIGIGVGSAAAALLAAGIVGLCFYLRRRRKRRMESSLPPPVPPKELAATPISYRAIPPPYELSEDASPRRPSMSASKRHLSAASSSRRSPLRAGRESGALGYNPVELDASEASLRDRASPESENSGWTDRQARGAAMPMPWI
ncbi:hypothetical protein MFIFM68171_03302 [Madurella fahalii]|uniref:Uncharacterized protein n=1 Tax=Madurella fahalii TaxID=1157608 RepID=A0ABQ0G5Q9_9PEZI